MQKSLSVWDSNMCPMYCTHLNTPDRFFNLLYIMTQQTSPIAIIWILDAINTCYSFSQNDLLSQLENYYIFVIGYLG